MAGGDGSGAATLGMLHSCPGPPQGRGQPKPSAAQFLPSQGNKAFIFTLTVCEILDRKILALLIEKPVMGEKHVLFWVQGKLMLVSQLL